MTAAAPAPESTPSTALTATAADNVRRWDGHARGHYEVWYLTCNHAPSQTGYWIRYTLEAPLAGVGEPYAQLWFARFDARDPAGTFGINRRFPIASMTATADPFGVAIAANRLGHDRARGSLAGAGHDVAWDLRWTPGARTLRQLPDVMYRRGGLGETTVLSPNVDVAMSGTITVDGRTLTLDAEPGGQTHLWGRKHAHAWGWGHCNAFDDHPGAAFEALTVHLQRRGVTLPPLTILTLRLDGEELAFNQFRHTLGNRGELATGAYRFRAWSPMVKLEGEFSARPEDMVVAHYHDPDGAASYCANTEIGDLRMTVSRRVGRRWREAARLVAPRRGHFEIGQRQRDPAVATDHVTVDA
ncbi:MAG: hypothetical protein H6709_02395 [Kofleriaceae bacterium]|nr:hypothetical protein [Myxococcales bacterium]MCB9570921.1 hypothetical protein [Kofleriaceae bacterium]